MVWRGGGGGGDADAVVRGVEGGCMLFLLLLLPGKLRCFCCRWCLSLWR